MQLNARGEVIDGVNVSQFYPGKTEYACGFYAAGTIRYAGEPGKGATGKPSEVEAWADSQYIAEYKNDGAAMVGGVSIDDEHRLLVAALPNSGTSHYFDLDITATTVQASDLAQLKGALLSGYPVVATVTEASIYDMELKRNPYWWGASGTHVIVLSGIDQNGNFLAHDSANVSGSLQGANTLLPGPRVYDASKIDVTWASMCRMPWLMPFPPGWSAASGVRLNQTAPTAVIPTVKPAIDYKNRSIVQRWRALGTNFDRTTVIFASWRAEHEAGHDHGVPLYPEQSKDADGNDLVDESGKKLVRQVFSKDTAEVLDGKVSWI